MALRRVFFVTILWTSYRSIRGSRQKALFLHLFLQQITSFTCYAVWWKNTHSKCNKENDILLCHSFDQSADFKRYTQARHPLKTYLQVCNPVSMEMRIPAMLGCHVKSNRVEPGEHMCMEKLRPTMVNFLFIGTQEIGTVLEPALTDPIKLQNQPYKLIPKTTACWKTPHHSIAYISILLAKHISFISVRI